MLWGNRPEAGRAYGTNPLRGFSAGAGEYTNVVWAYTGIIDCRQVKKMPVSRRSECKVRNAIIVKRIKKTTCSSNRRGSTPFVEYSQ
tara:strand:- start:1542 stop:1802 length:261 start_codon:yes stop_codon:yes gene_type:complete